MTPSQKIAQEIINIEVDGERSVDAFKNIIRKKYGLDFTPEQNHPSVSNINKEWYQRDLNDQYSQEGGSANVPDKDSPK